MLGRGDREPSPVSLFLLGIPGKRTLLNYMIENLTYIKNAYILG